MSPIPAMRPPHLGGPPISYAVRLALLYRFNLRIAAIARHRRSIREDQWQAALPLFDKYQTEIG